MNLKSKAIVLASATRSWRVTALAAALLLGGCPLPGSVDSSKPSLTSRDVTVPGVLGVANSVQQVFYPGSVDALSVAVPRCTETIKTDCYSGLMLAVQAVKIGYTANEPTIGVASDGTAYFAGSAMVVDTALTWAGAATNIHRSTDGGLTWKSVQPNVGGESIPPANADPLIYLDPGTDRIFVFDLLGACQTLSYSDDKGETWTTNPLACGTPPVDHQTLVAVPPLGPIATIGYPNMLIWCSNRVADGACGRSFDGGLTWSPGGDPYLGVSASDGECGGLGGHLAGDADGRLYMPTGHCGYPDVAVSSDGGLTWAVHRVSDIVAGDTHTSVATDSAGNVYYGWFDDQQQPYLSYSTDHGTTWSKPMLVAPPDVAKANFVMVAGGAPGHVAINFPSQIAGLDDEIWDQTMVISENVFAEKPIFLSATANDHAQPIHRGPCAGRCDGMWDFIDTQISSAGEAWGSASFDCNGECLTKGTVVSDHSGQGVMIRQIAGPKLR